MSEKTAPVGSKAVGSKAVGSGAVGSGAAADRWERLAPRARIVAVVAGIGAARHTKFLYICALDARPNVRAVSSTTVNDVPAVLDHPLTGAATTV